MAKAIKTIGDSKESSVRSDLQSDEDGDATPANQANPAA